MNEIDPFQGGLPELGEDYNSPIDFGVIRDPETGAETAVFELYQIGELDEEMSGHVDRTLDRMRALRENEFEDPIDYLNARSMVKLSVLRFADLISQMPDGTQHLVVGRDNAYAVSVSYADPHGTPPKQHYELRTTLDDLTGGEYFTIGKKTADIHEFFRGRQ